MWGMEELRNQWKRRKIMEMGARGALVEFNRICKENNEIYHGVTRALGLTDCAFWILYTLRGVGRGIYPERFVCGIV